jgi:hypothetical protein
MFRCHLLERHEEFGDENGVNALPLHARRGVHAHTTLIEKNPKRSAALSLNAAAGPEKSVFVDCSRTGRVRAGACTRSMALQALQADSGRLQTVDRPAHHFVALPSGRVKSRGRAVDADGRLRWL